MKGRSLTFDGAVSGLFGLGCQPQNSAGMSTGCFWQLEYRARLVETTQNRVKLFPVHCKVYEHKMLGNFPFFVSFRRTNLSRPHLTYLKLSPRMLELGRDRVQVRTSRKMRKSIATKITHRSTANRHSSLPFVVQAGLPVPVQWVSSVDSRQNVRHSRDYSQPGGHCKYR